MMPSAGDDDMAPSALSRLRRQARILIVTSGERPMVRMGWA